MRVLVVEDHVELARDIAEGLRDRGIATDLAYDGAAALKKSLDHRCDVIVLDAARPGRGGRRHGRDGSCRWPARSWVCSRSCWRPMARWSVPRSCSSGCGMRTPA